MGILLPGNFRAKHYELIARHGAPGLPVAKIISFERDLIDWFYSESGPIEHDLQRFCNAALRMGRDAKLLPDEAQRMLGSSIESFSDGMELLATWAHLSRHAKQMILASARVAPRAIPISRITLSA
jgi:hypothetical protein